MGNPVTLTEKEFIAMTDFNMQYRGSTFENKVKTFKIDKNQWTNAYLPLAEMGMEKFIDCLIDGFKIREPEYVYEDVTVSFNASVQHLIETPDYQRPIYIKISDFQHASLPIEKAEFLIDSLTATVDYYKKNIKGGR